MPGASPETEIVDAKASAEAPADTKAAVETVVETKPTETKDAPAAESSTAKPEGDKKGDMLSAVKAALKPKTETAPTSDEPGSKPDLKPEDPAEKDGEEAGDESEDLTEEELNRLRPKTRKRIDNLLRDRSERDTKIADLEPKAKQFEQISTFVTEAGLTKDEVNNGFGVMRDLKRDPERAYQTLKPIYQQLAAMFGEGDLPNDLRQDVQLGRITEDRARELAGVRTKARLAAERTDFVQTRQQEQQKAQEFQNTVNDVANAVTEWERSKEKSDPSWKLKQPRIQELVELEIARRQRSNPQYFPTKDEALKFSNDALAKVDTEYKRFAPKPRTITPNTDGASSRSMAKPASALEAAKQALAKMAG